MNNPSDQEELQHEINSLRLLVFLETEPQSNMYNQVYLNKEQFKKISDIISKKVSVFEELRKGMEASAIVVSDDEYHLPDLKEINE